MFGLHWLLRARYWIAHPPSAARVAVVAAAILICLAILGIEHFIGWPDWASTTPTRRPILR